MAEKNSVFLKQSEIPSIEHKLSHNLLLESIPPDTFPEEQVDLVGNKIEWRWRFLDIYGKKLVEISYLPLKGCGDRKYIDRFGKWVDRNIDPIYDRYVVKKHYYYSDS
jgi:hypothetical protein